jgi:hypothetical protein
VRLLQGPHSSTQTGSSCLARPRTMATSTGGSAGPWHRRHDLRPAASAAASGALQPPSAAAQTATAAAAPAPAQAQIIVDAPADPCGPCDPGWTVSSCCRRRERQMRQNQGYEGAYSAMPGGASWVSARLPLPPATCRLRTICRCRSALLVARCHCTSNCEICRLVAELS